LAMTARDLATWDIAVINHAILRTASYRVQQATALLANGTPTNYGLGLGVSAQAGRRQILHSGEVSGYTTMNMVYPDDKAAIVVLTNIYPGGSEAAGQIASGIASIILADTSEKSAREMARRVYNGLAHGTIDRNLLTPDAQAYFSPQVLEDFAASLGP